MCNFDSVQHVHVLGICGSGMAPFAGLLQARGLRVTGSDQNVHPPMSTMLEGLGIPVCEGYAPENLDSEPDLVVVGNVIRRTNPEATAVRQRGLLHTSFPDALARLFLTDRRPLVITGTHGKTTTSSILASLLQGSGGHPGFLVGGIPLAFGRSFEIGRGRHFIVEGDEYDTAYFDKGPKFLHYRPEIAILTGIEFDHADIYADLAAVTRSFRRFVRLIPPTGALLVCGHETLAREVARECPGEVETYGTDPDFDWHAETLTSDAAGTRFVLRHRGQVMGEMTTPTWGRHNLLNVVAALAVAIREGFPADTLTAALAAFQGVKKRQEVRGVADGVTVIDDFAHHPTAVRETIRAVRQRFPNARLWAAFHPQSNTSRRRVFQREYPEAFAAADIAIIAQALRKRDHLKPEDELSVAELVDDIRGLGVEAHGDMPIDEVLAVLLERCAPGDVVLAMSGKDFGGLHDKLLAGLRARAQA